MVSLRVFLIPYILVLLPYLNVKSFDLEDESITTLAINEGVPYVQNRERIKLQPNYHWHLPTSYYTNNFSEFIRESHMFADKSLFIKAIMECPNRTIIITSPSRWGKTVNLQMLKAFLEIQVDTAGNRIEPLSETKSYQLFKHGRINENKTLRQPPLISKYDDLFIKHQGKWPVVYMDMNCFDVTNIVLFRHTLREQMGEAFKDHAYMLTALERIISSNTSSAEQKAEAANDHEKFFRYMYYNSTIDDLLFSLKFLTKVLYKHYNHKVIVLLDDYDQVLTNLELELHSESLTESSIIERARMIAFYHNFLMRSFRNNAFVNKSVLTGATSLAKDIPGDLFGEFVDYNIFTNPLHRFFGYNQHELKLIYDHLKVPRHEQTLIDQWWNGIVVYLPKPTTITNMYMVNIFLREGRHLHYNDGMILILQFILPEWMKMPYFEEAWAVLISGNNYTIPLHSFEFTYSQISYIYHAMERSMGEYDYYYEAGPKACYYTLHYFLVNGIVTLADHKPDPDSPNITLATLRVPNIQNYYFLGNLSLGHYSHHRFQMLNLRVSFLCRKIASHFVQFMTNDHNQSEPFETLYNEVYNEMYPNLDVRRERKLPYIIRKAAIPNPGFSSNESWSRSFLYLTFTSSQMFIVHRWPNHRDKTMKPAVVATRDKYAIIAVADSEYKHSLLPPDTPIERFINVTAYIDLFKQSYPVEHLESVKIVLVREISENSYLIRGHKEIINAPQLPSYTTLYPLI